MVSLKTLCGKPYLVPCPNILNIDVSSGELYFSSSTAAGRCSVCRAWVMEPGREIENTIYNVDPPTFDTAEETAEAADNCHHAAALQLT